MKLPSTPEEVIAFIGSNYNTRIGSGVDDQNIVYTLTVHDLLEAFRELEDFPLRESEP